MLLHNNTALSPNHKRQGRVLFLRIIIMVWLFRNSLRGSLLPV